jgi:uncharacterized membrane protein YbhN (UPF0104 family)
MKKKIDRKKDIGFLLENREYRKLHLFLYITTAVVIVIIYLLLTTIFSQYSPIYVTAPISLIIGIFLVYKKEKIIKWLSEIIYERKRRNLKKQNKEAHKNTLKKIVPKKRDIKFNVGGKVAFKDKVKNWKNKILPKKKTEKKGPDYIEIE